MTLWSRLVLSRTESPIGPLLVFQIERLPVSDASRNRRIQRPLGESIKCTLANTIKYRTTSLFLKWRIYSSGEVGVPSHVNVRSWNGLGRCAMVWPGVDWPWEIPGMENLSGPRSVLRNSRVSFSEAPRNRQKRISICKIRLSSESQSNIGARTSFTVKLMIAMYS